MAGLYLHIPFCKRRCVYCDFYSTTFNDDVRANYVESLCNELSIRKSYLGTSSLQSIYLGGGTPSQLSPNELGHIFCHILKLFTLSSDCEITLEANPDDLNPDYVKALRQLPVNRISIGIQTFNDNLLNLLQRRHTGLQALQAVDLCYRYGLENISIDLIYGLPGQSLNDWNADLNAALNLPVKHLSAYSLTYEEGTRLWTMREKKEIHETDEETSLQMFNSLIDHAEQAGFKHYEISNFCRKGYQAIHNSSYWKGDSYLGCGPGAHSFNGTSRQWNKKDLPAYLKKNGNVFPDLIETEHLTEQERYNDFVITTLRTSNGLDLHKLHDTFGDASVQYALAMAQPYLKQRTLELTSATPSHPKGVLRLTRKGIFLSDIIMSDLLSVD